MATTSAEEAEFVTGTQGPCLLTTINLQELEVDTLFWMAMIGLTLYFAVASLRKVLIPRHEP
jgi:NitT/TauT family transport system permease protein